VWYPSGILGPKAPSVEDVKDRMKCRYKQAEGGRGRRGMQLSDFPLAIGKDDKLDVCLVL